MWELLGQILSVVLSNAGQALGRFSGRILLTLMLVIAIGCALLVSCRAG
ncbi:hypothetical protein ACK1O1_05320 [Stenotrophomonas maltophilia]|jgi:hypothetical protein|nr:MULTISPECIES: hypothetical protein [Stenotrophomonas]MBN5024758.1 hypothetical protein [Stenotrophomonas maltophilia]MDH1273311.1 hypothetical protein [Stenotrophomonas sp. GD03937]MDH1485697.1 hypothetical protein [Stenotrophomonas sp. GD03712]UQY97754.1 hypothetical protein LZ605_10490 [Stenotrophomonas maltophilia]WON69775.1 hypothetical protein RWT08_05395 [Stenotrophomonas maltophilia]